MLDRRVNPELARIRAERILVYYLKTVWLKAGLEWTSDNEAEITGVVTDIINAGNE